jgi:hypothetical protein
LSSCNSVALWEPFNFFVTFLIICWHRPRREILLMWSVWETDLLLQVRLRMWCWNVPLEMMMITGSHVWKGSFDVGFSCFYSFWCAETAMNPIIRVQLMWHYSNLQKGHQISDLFTIHLSSWFSSTCFYIIWSCFVHVTVCGNISLFVMMLYYVLKKWEVILILSTERIHLSIKDVFWTKAHFGLPFSWERLHWSLVPVPVVSIG